MKCDYLPSNPPCPKYLAEIQQNRMVEVCKQDIVTYLVDLMRRYEKSRADLLFYPGKGMSGVEKAFARWLTRSKYSGRQLCKLYSAVIAACEDLLDAIYNPGRLRPVLLNTLATYDDWESYKDTRTPEEFEVLTGINMELDERASHLMDDFRKILEDDTVTDDLAIAIIYAIHRSASIKQNK